MKLDEFLAAVYDRTQRIFPRSVHRTILTWILQRDQVRVQDHGDPNVGWVNEIPFPAEWASTSASWNETINIKWGEGAWSDGLYMSLSLPAYLVQSSDFSVNEAGLIIDNVTKNVITGIVPIGDLIAKYTPNIDVDGVLSFGGDVNGLIVGAEVLFGNVQFGTDVFGGDNDQINTDVVPASGIEIPIGNSTFVGVLDTMYWQPPIPLIASGSVTWSGVLFIPIQQRNAGLQAFTGAVDTVYISADYGPGFGTRMFGYERFGANTDEGIDQTQAPANPARSLSGALTLTGGLTIARNVGGSVSFTRTLAKQVKGDMLFGTHSFGASTSIIVSETQAPADPTQDITGIVSLSGALVTI